MWLRRRGRKNVIFNELFPHSLNGFHPIGVTLYQVSSFAVYAVQRVVRTGVLQLQNGRDDDECDRDQIISNFQELHVRRLDQVSVPCKGCPEIRNLVHQFNKYIVTKTNNFKEIQFKLQIHRSSLCKLMSGYENRDPGFLFDYTVNVK